MIGKEVQMAVEKLKSPELASALMIQSVVLREVHLFMHEKGVLQLLPVMISPITDPLNHSVMDGEISYYDSRLQLTKSMILHKQLSLVGKRDAVYVISPNVRLETMEKGATGRHLLEFTQVDYELKGKSAKDVIGLTEKLFVRIVGRVLEECGPELELFPRIPAIPHSPFKKYDSKELQGEYGDDWEGIISSISTEPVWVTNHEREFYDKEDPQKPFSYLNYDLIYPEGFGEALSGAEREHEYVRILERMHRKKMDLGPYKAYLEVAREGLLHPSAGAGFGVERLVRYICGAKRIEDISPFGKVPGGRFVF